MGRARTLLMSVDTVGSSPKRVSVCLSCFVLGRKRNVFFAEKTKRAHGFANTHTPPPSRGGGGWGWAVASERRADQSIGTMLLISLSFSRNCPARDGLVTIVSCRVHHAARACVRCWCGREQTCVSHALVL